MSDPATKLLDDRIQRAVDDALAKRSSGGDSGSMDLTTRVQSLEEMVGKIALDLAEIKGRISQMPTTMQLWAAVLSSVGLASALVFGAIKIAGQ